jgi:3-deoxy-manno-octulosonate cytidylyltransferase (CMP-KDO synthetase)
MRGHRTVIVVIPARYASTRFPGKALADLGGKSVLRRCYERVAAVVPTESIYVATDDSRIVDECNRYSMQSVMTSTACLTGTDRVAEVAKLVDSDWYVNVQGDEPFLNPSGLRDLLSRLSLVSQDVSVFNAYTRITDEAEFRSPTVPKVVTSFDNRLLYVSRAGVPTNKSLQYVSAHRQVGLYAFRKDALAGFAANGSKTPLESLEDIEILRFLELGFTVEMIEVPNNGLAIDTPEDLERARLLLKSVD